jgi:integrase
LNKLGKEIVEYIANSGSQLRAKPFQRCFNCSKKRGCVLEALKLKWTDLDFERKTVRITPEKGSLPRILLISDKAIAMLKKLPINARATFLN